MINAHSLSRLFTLIFISSHLAPVANAADSSASRKTGVPVSPSSIKYCFGDARCFELETKDNRFHAVERFKDTPYKVTEIDNSTFENIKTGASEFEAWAKKSSAGSKHILRCRREFSVIEDKTTRTICLDSINDKEKALRTKALISLFTQAKPIAKSSTGAIPDCSPASSTDSAMCTVEEKPHAPPTKKSK